MKIRKDRLYWLSNTINAFCLTLGMYHFYAYILQVEPFYTWGATIIVAVFSPSIVRAKWPGSERTIRRWKCRRAIGA